MRYAADDMPAARYIVLTRLGDSWILRAAHEDAEAAEAEAFRWRRIYGRDRTRIAAWGNTAPELPLHSPAPTTLPALPLAIIDVTPEPANDLAGSDIPASIATPAPARPARHRQRKRRDRSQNAPLGWGETLLRALVLYFAYSIANRLIDLAILMQGA